MNQYDYLIIGQGLAGSLLAYKLFQRNQTFLILDNAENNASHVAAGLINPVTGMRLVKANNIEELLFTAKIFYRQLEGFLNQSFYTELPMLRVLKNEQEYLSANKRFKQEDYRSYIEEYHLEDKYINSSFGIAKQKQTALLNIPSILLNLKQFFIDKNCYLEERFNVSELSINTKVKWKEYEFNSVIFCEGYKQIENIYFNWLPLKPVKGEILTIGLNDNQIIKNNILNYGYWLTPFGTETYRTGATFDRGFSNIESTKNARNELLSEFKYHINYKNNIDIVKHEVGIRPTTIDREPMIGMHPKYKQLYTFNGFGTKGSLLIPYYSECLINNLYEKTPLPSNANIERFYEKYSIN